MNTQQIANTRGQLFGPALPAGQIAAQVAFFNPNDLRVIADEAMAGNLMEHWLDTADAFVEEFMEVVKQCEDFEQLRINDEDLWANLEARTSQRNLTQKAHNWEKVSDSWGQAVLDHLQTVSIGMSMAERTGYIARHVEHWDYAV